MLQSAIVNKNVFYAKELNYTQRWILSNLLLFANGETGKAFPTIKKLEETSGVCSRSIIKSIKVLEEKGFITKKRAAGRNSIYYISENYLGMNAPDVTEDILQSSDEMALSSDDAESVATCELKSPLEITENSDTESLSGSDLKSPVTGKRKKRAAGEKKAATCDMQSNADSAVMDVLSQCRDIIAQFKNEMMKAMQDTVREIRSGYGMPVTGDFKSPVGNISCEKEVTCDTESVPLTQNQPSMVIQNHMSESTSVSENADILSPVTENHVQPVHQNHIVENTDKTTPTSESESHDGPVNLNQVVHLNHEVVHLNQGVVHLNHEVVNDMHTNKQITDQLTNKLTDTSEASVSSSVKKDFIEGETSSLTPKPDTVPELPHASDITPSAETSPSSKPSSGTSRKKKEKESYAEQFEQWYAGYPRKQGKAAAARSFEKLRQHGVSFEDLARARDVYAAEVKEYGYAQRYIKMASSFLGRDEPWKEYANKNTSDFAPRSRFLGNLDNAFIEVEAKNYLKEDFSYANDKSAVINYRTRSADEFDSEISGTPSNKAGQTDRDNSCELPEMPF